MTNKIVIKQMLLNILPVELDPYLAAENLCRSGNSLDYRRQVDTGIQHFELIFDLKPRYEPQALAHLLPRIRLVYPKLNQRVLDMMGNMPSLEDENGITFSQQLQNAAPRNVRIPALHWFIYDVESAHNHVSSIREYLKQWGIPFLNKYSTLAAIIDGYEQKDECLLYDRRFLLFIVAAYTILGQSSKAMQILESKFGKPMLRREYAKAFEYVSGKL
jgi:hypothetical protein